MRELQSLLEKLRTEEEPVQLKVLQKTIAELYNNDLYLFAKYGLHYNEVVWSTHGELIQILESEAIRKLITFPRGGFKSSIAVESYCIWRLNKNPNLRILIDSELYTNSSNFLRVIKNHMESPELTSIYGDYKSNNWNEGELTIKQRTKVRKEASITCGGVGTTKVGQHYDLIIGDDYNSKKNSDTPEKCQKVIDHVKYNLSILDPGGEYVFIGTRYAERDVLGWLLGEILQLKDLAEGKLITKGFFNGQTQAQNPSGLLK